VQVRYNQLGIGDPAFTYGIIFVPDSPLKQPQPLLEDQKLRRGCYWYKVNNT
jgi:hypothetical protein